MSASEIAAAPTLHDNFLNELGRRAGATGRHLKHNPKLLVGFLLLLFLIGLAVIGPLFVDVAEANPMAVEPDMAPSRHYIFGTDSQGRNLLALMIRGIPLTLRVGLQAGAIGLGIGILLGFVSGYAGGVVDTVIRSLADIMLSVPGLMVLIVIAASIKGLISIQAISLVVASLAWMYPTRTIRSQVLTLRERPYVEMAKLNGMSGRQIILRELLPNLLPYLGASFVGAVGSAILATIGLEALGLGPQHEPTLGMTIYWAIFYSALLRGLWWWWAAPVGVIVILFTALFLISLGLDELANPRLRRAAG
ncbi:MAG TPA: ABC transporter permease [Thermomicrobiales bacterium]|nr:ABC transporter permease [Thermomicrobiales bacterium]